MADRSEKISELGSITGANVAGGDLIPVVDISANTTKSMSVTELRYAVVRGPYANDEVANTNSVLVGQLYYNANGDVKVRIS